MGAAAGSLAHILHIIYIFIMMVTMMPDVVVVVGLDGCLHSEEYLAVVTRPVSCKK